MFNLRIQMSFMVALTCLLSVHNTIARSLSSELESRCAVECGNRGYQCFVASGDAEYCISSTKKCAKLCAEPNPVEIY
ncbi:hypothetical protein CSKR_203020 [Clonorchis sinensis]|uniref:Uncharacterized protein n=1 Tax=Clonorchis sinensis TaxID=79923 RepID=A0A8T1M6T8_CLOSI|nr:hypothetical protein CSKR_203020 [Clonorchis sinensis]